MAVTLRCCSSLLALLVCSLCAASVSAAALEVTGVSFEEKVLEAPRALVFFYAPWCGHCKRFKPEYDRLADLVSGTTVAKVNAIEETGLAKKYDVTAYPDVRLFVNGRLHADFFKGLRAAEQVMHWMDNVARGTSDVQDVVHVREIEELQRRGKTGIVSFYTENCKKCQEGKRDLEIASLRLWPQTPVLSVNCDRHGEFCRKEQIKSFPHLRVYTDGVSAEYRKKITFVSLPKDIEALRKSETATKRVTRRNWSSFVPKEGSAFVLFVESNDAGRSAELAAEMVNFLAAEKELPQVGIVRCGKTKKLCARKLDRKDKLPLLIHYRDGKRASGALAGNVDQSGILSTMEQAEMDSDGSLEYLSSHEDMQKAIQSSKNVLIAYLASWCPHCRKFGPELIKAKRELAKDRIRVYAIDCSAQKSLCRREGIEFYPVLRAYRRGKFVNPRYSDKLEKDQVVDYARKVKSREIKSSLLEDLTLGTFDRSVKSSEFAFVAFIAPWCAHCKRLLPELEDVAKLIERKESLKIRIKLARVDCETESELREKYKVSSYPVLRLFAKGEDQEVYSGERSSAAIMKYLETQLNGGVETISAAEESNYAQKHDFAVVAQGNRAVSVVRDVVPLAVGAYDVASISPAEANENKLKIYSKGVVVGEFRGQLPTAEELHRKVSSFMRVKIVTKGNFDHIIAENDVVLLEFVAPWCGHCKRLAPEFEAAAETLRGSATLGKVDATREVTLASRFNVEGYPTLVLFKNGKREAFSAERNRDAIVKAVGEHVKDFVLPSEDTGGLPDKIAMYDPDEDDDEGERDGGAVKGAGKQSVDEL